MSNLKTERSFCFVFLVCSSECLYHHTGIGTCVSALWLIKGILGFFYFSVICSSVTFEYLSLSYSMGKQSNLIIMGSWVWKAAAFINCCCIDFDFACSWIFDGNLLYSVLEYSSFHNCDISQISLTMLLTCGGVFYNHLKYRTAVCKITADLKCFENRF